MSSTSGFVSSKATKQAAEARRLRMLAERDRRWAMGTFEEYLDEVRQIAANVDDDLAWYRAQYDSLVEKYVTRPQQIATFRQTLHDLVTLAHREVLDFWTAIDKTDPVAATRALEDFMPRLIAEYGDAGAAAASDFYDTLRASKDFASDYGATVASSTPPEQIAASVRNATSALFSAAPDEAAALQALAGITQRYTLAPARETITKAAALDPEKPRWARVPSGTKTCAFCMAMASRGPVYTSEATASEGFHDDCYCVAVPAWELDDITGEEYGLAEMQKIVADATKRARSSSLKGPDGILAAMRRQSTEVAEKTVAKMQASAAAGNGSGATINILTRRSPTTGYSLAVKGYERVVPTDNLNAEIAAFIDDNKVALAGDYRFLGTWENEGQVYLDVVEVWPDRASTIALAHERGELAIYDLAAGEEIPTT